MLSKKAYRYDLDKIKNELSRLRSSISQKPIMVLYQLLHKVGRHLCAGLYVDLKALDKVKMLVNEPQNRIIFVPTNKSFTDLLFLQYVHYM